MKYTDIVDILKIARQNNSREWYMQKKAVFREIHGTLTELYLNVGNRIRKETAIDITPTKSISRPYNDQRFGNKPYLRERLWVTFRSNALPMPAFFIEFSPYQVRIGMGYYSATPAQMRDLRAKIDDAPQRFSDALEKVLADQKIQMISTPYKKEFTTNYQGKLKELYHDRSVYFQKIIPPEQWEELELLSADTFLELNPLYHMFVT